MANVFAVCISEEKGTPKHEVAQICLQEGHGILGDAHAGNWHRQVSLLGMESVEKVKAVLPDLAPGAFAENILTSGLTLYSLPVGTKIRVGEAILEITQIGKECHQGCHPPPDRGLRYASGGRVCRCSERRDGSQRG